MRYSLEPYPRQGRAAGGEGRPHRRHPLRSRRRRHPLSDGLDRQGLDRGAVRRERRGGSGRIDAENRRRLLLDQCRGIGRMPRADRAAAARSSSRPRSAATANASKPASSARSPPGPKAAFDLVQPYILAFAPRGVSYVGEGELSRICKIAHNVVSRRRHPEPRRDHDACAQKAGVPRHAFLEFINNSVMGSIFTRYKSNALVNLDWTTTFTPTLLRKDLDLGLAAARGLDVPMPVTAATREALQAHFGAATLAARSSRLSGEGFRRDDRDRRACGRAEAGERECARADRAGGRGIGIVFARAGAAAARSADRSLRPPCQLNAHPVDPETGGVPS